MPLTEFIKNKNKINKLGLDVDKVIETVNDMKKSGHHFNDEEDLFYYYILNLFGKIILSIDSGDVTRAEMMGWLKVKKSDFNGKVMYFYRFETEDDYFLWLNMRKDIYAQITDQKELRLLNFIELSTFDFVVDGQTNGKYNVYQDGKKLNTIQKTGMICAHDGSKFMKTMATNFNDLKYFKPI